jgi:hypothetical protein
MRIGIPNYLLLYFVGNIFPDEILTLAEISRIDCSSQDNEWNKYIKPSNVANVLKTTFWIYEVRHKLTFYILEAKF